MCKRRLGPRRAKLLVMRSQTYADKQREAQRRKKQEELWEKSTKPESAPTSEAPTNADKSDQTPNKTKKEDTWPAFCLDGASPPILELRRFLYLYLLLTSDPLGSPQNPAHKGSLLSEEQEEAAHGRQNNYHHLLSALQFPQERQGIFYN